MSRYPTLLNSNTFIQLPIDSYDDDDVSLAGIHALVLDLKESSSPLTYLKIASTVKRLLLSLKGASFSLFEILKLWELRIIALIFITRVEIQLPKEQQSSKFKIQSTKYIKNEVDILIPELYKINKLRKQHELIGHHQKQRQPAEQFPREVSDSFKFLLLRIRYGPSLMLVNEYYSHIWRSKDKTIPGLHKLSFSIAAVLIARQEYLTLISLVNSILINVSNSEPYTNKLILIRTIVKLIRIEKENLPLTADIEAEFQELSDLTALQSLNHVLNEVAPIYNDPDSFPLKEKEIYETNSDNNFAKIHEQVKNLDITGRIMCTLCAFFEIEISREELVPEAEQAAKEDDVDALILQSLKLIQEGWVNNVTKYYGLE